MENSSHGNVLLENLPDHAKGERDTDKTVMKLSEALAPSEQKAQEIRSIIETAAAEIVTDDPHPDTRRVMETAVGIYEWENMVRETGNSLPVGLVFKEGGLWKWRIHRLKG